MKGDHVKRKAQMKTSTILQLARAKAQAGHGFAALPDHDPAFCCLMDACAARSDHWNHKWTDLKNMRGTFDIAISMAMSDEAVWS